MEETDHKNEEETKKQIKRTNSDWKFVINIEELNYKAENKIVQNYNNECVTLIEEFSWN